jgi:hypothetical protein
VTTYATPYDPQRVRLLRLGANTRGPATVDFRAVLQAGETLQSVTWESDSIETVSIVSANIGDTATTAVLYARTCGEACMRVTAVTSEARQLVQEMTADVRGGRQFSQGPDTGSASINASVPG